MEANTPPQAAPDAGNTGAVPVPQTPVIDHAPETPEEVLALSAAFAEMRKEIAQFRAETASRGPRPTMVAVTETLADRTAAREAEIAKHSFYCYGCGQLFDYQQKCSGTPAAPHKPLDVVPTGELQGDPAAHTAAPSTDEQAA